MNQYVLDTSVAVAWYLTESFSDAARKWQRSLLNDAITCIVPNLHYWELANVLRTYVARREIDVDLANEIYLLHLDAPLEVAEPCRASVITVAHEYSATAYDAVYIALSLEHDLPLVTAEKSTPRGWRNLPSRWSRSARRTTKRSRRNESLYFLPPSRCPSP